MYTVTKLLVRSGMGSSYFAEANLSIGVGLMTRRNQLNPATGEFALCNYNKTTSRLAFEMP